MTTVVRTATELDWEPLSEYDDRGHRYGFPTVIAERDDVIVGYMSSRPGREDAIECHAIKADSSIIALRLMEAYESILDVFDVKGYIFSVSKDAPEFMDVVLKLPETVQYGESADYIFAMRMLTHERRQQSPSSLTH